jgi:3-hydroxyisobutyrate dehydrogenase-like beta-hydroxyacid dehydrogenase
MLLKILVAIPLTADCMIPALACPACPQVAKICNNLVMGVTMAGLAEALALGAAAGLDPAALSSLINAASGRCWSSEVYNPVPVRGPPPTC